MALRVGLVLFSLVLPLLALEVALRVLGPIFPGNYSTGYFLTTHPSYGRFHVRGYSGWEKTREYTTYVRTNSLGLRGAEVSPAKPVDVFRIVVVGDSIVEAAQVMEEQTFAQRLERSLNSSSPSRRVEVLNAGVGGWGTGQEMLYLRQEGLRLQPDLVLLVLYSGNDIANNSSKLERQDVLDSLYKPYWEIDASNGLRQVPHRERIPEALDEWLWLGRRSSALFNYVETGFFDKFKYGQLDFIGDRADLGKPVLLAQYPPEWEESWQVTERLLAAAAQDSAAAGSGFVVVLAPSTFQVMPDDWRDLIRTGRRPASDWDQEKPNKKMAGITARRGLPLIDLLPALRAARDAGLRRLYFEHDKHWTATGHEVVAQALEEQLRRLGLLP